VRMRENADLAVSHHEPAQSVVGDVPFDRRAQGLVDEAPPRLPLYWVGQHGFELPPGSERLKKTRPGDLRDGGFEREKLPESLPIEVRAGHLDHRPLGPL